MAIPRRLDFRPLGQEVAARSDHHLILIYALNPQIRLLRELVLSRQPSVRLASPSHDECVTEPRTRSR
jgi:hypothetical protein